MAKLTENSFRDVNIAFANELSVICDSLNIDVWDLIDLANHHPRVNILQPGPGVGGHCIAVDPWFIVSSAPETSRLIRTAREVNDSKPEWVLDKINKAVAESGADTIAVFGLAFKPNIDDLRESPSMDIAESVAERFGSKKVLVVEPNIPSLPSSFADLDNVELVSVEDALARAGVLALLVDHDEFKTIAEQELEGKHIVDAKGLWG